MGIRGLAKALGLSIGTVSRALNDKPDVHPATRARVKEAARRIGYVPDQAARSLRRRRTGIVAAVIPAIGAIPGPDAVILQIFEAARRRLSDADLDLIVLFRGPELEPLEHLRRIAERNIADAIILTPTRRDDPRVGYLNERRIPHVAFGRSQGLAATAWVDFDVEAAIVRAVELYAAGGHRRFALAIRDSDASFNDLMAGAFTARTARRGIAPEQAVILRFGPAGFGDGDLRRLAAVAPTALIAADDGVAAALYAAVGRRGGDVGRDAAVICILPTGIAEALRPRLSSFEADLDAFGRELGERLLAAMSNGTAVDPPGPSRPFPMTFAPRESHLLGRAEA